MDRCLFGVSRLVWCALSVWDEVEAPRDNGGTDISEAWGCRWQSRGWGHRGDDPRIRNTLRGPRRLSHNSLRLFFFSRGSISVSDDALWNWQDFIVKPSGGLLLPSFRPDIRMYSFLIDCYLLKETHNLLTKYGLLSDPNEFLALCPFSRMGVFLFYVSKLLEACIKWARTQQRVMSVELAASNSATRNGFRLNLCWLHFC